MAAGTKMKCGLCFEDLEEPMKMVTVDNEEQFCHQACIDNLETEARMEQ